MTRLLLTGLSGVGKSTVARELGARGYRAVDVDEAEWSHWTVTADADPVRVHDGVPQDWVWREDRIQALLSVEDAGVLFVSGSASNQVQFYPQFDHIVLLSAPAELMAERLSTRTTNPYGRDPEEFARALRLKQTVEPLLRRGVSLEVDTSVPLDQVVKAILHLVR